jgi:hypothetical protein
MAVLVVVKQEEQENIAMKIAKTFLLNTNGSGVHNEINLEVTHVSKKSYSDSGLKPTVQRANCVSPKIN